MLTFNSKCEEWQSFITNKSAEVEKKERRICEMLATPQRSKQRLVKRVKLLLSECEQLEDDMNVFQQHMQAEEGAELLEKDQLKAEQDELVAKQKELLNMLGDKKVMHNLSLMAGDGEEEEDVPENSDNEETEVKIRDERRDGGSPCSTLSHAFLASGSIASFSSSQL